MNIKDYFTNEISYAASIEEWCKNLYPKELEYTFAIDFAFADWNGVDGVKETFKRVKKEWINNLKAWTEIVITLNLLSWAHNQMKKQGFDDRDRFINLYSDLYYMATENFYEVYDDNEEAKTYFFNMID